MKVQWLADPNQRPLADLGTLGELPRGFYRSGSGISCDDAAPGYVRGILLPTQTYNALSFDDRFKLKQPDVYPRWRLYGGPFSLRSVAQQWDEYLHFWGFNNGYTFVSHGVVCIVPDYILKWPADKSLRWDWVYEKGHPTVASRHYDQSQNKYVVTYGTVASPPSTSPAQQASFTPSAPQAGQDSSAYFTPASPQSGVPGDVVFPPLKKFENTAPGE